MRQILFYKIAIIIMCTICCCTNSTTNHENTDRDLALNEKELIRADNLFGLNLFRETVVRDNSSNVILSPLSVSMALGMALNGAEGSTREEMEKTLEFHGLSREDINLAYYSLIDLLVNLDPSVSFEIANSIWTREGFAVKDSFYTLNHEYFDARMDSLDFSNSEAAGIINDWVSQKTHDKITKIIESPIDPMTMMFLINAIYFKGDWTISFDSEQTKDRPFYLSDGGLVSCRLMYMEDTLNYIYNENFKAVELPYGDSGFSMVIFLPREINIEDDIDNFVESLTAENWNNWLGQFDTTNIELYLPKFELKYKIGFKEILASLGMEAAFDPQRSDFSSIADRTDLHISEVLHKTYIKVDELGTEAAAVTAVSFGITSLPPDETIMRVDRPFVFAIKENKSNGLIFVGKIGNPLE